MGVSVSVSNNVIDDEEQHNTANNTTANASSAVVSSVTLAGPSVSNTENNSSGRFLLHANFPSLFESNNINRHDESVSGNGDASNESATPGMY